MPRDDFAELAAVLQSGLTDKTGEKSEQALRALIESRYHANTLKKIIIRNAYGLSNYNDDEGAAYAGIIHPENPSKGRYAGSSLVWFPSTEDGSLIGFGVGTLGLGPDVGLLGRPGHRRRVHALRRLLNSLGVLAWSKPDPSAINQGVPASVMKELAPFEAGLSRYQKYMYCVAHLRNDLQPHTARKIVAAFFDLYAFERLWQVRQAAAEDFDDSIDSVSANLFEFPTVGQVHDLLRQRRFVVLQGPPGTGKTRMADEIRREYFKGRGKTVQFHPSVTYEDFVVGLSPEPAAEGLHFRVKPGWLLQAARAAKDGAFLLVIDEINRADLGRTLGEAVYLFEADEVGGPDARIVELAHAVADNTTFALPENLYVLATMNTADRSIAKMDLAVRRRFAFVNLPPDPKPVAATGVQLAVDAFRRVRDVFTEFAPDDVVDLMPGHAYFLARDERDLRARFKHGLLPLIEDYLAQGLLGMAQAELSAVRDWLSDKLSTRA